MSAVTALDSRKRGLALPTLSQIFAEKARRKGDASRANFHTFLRYFAWPTLQPGTVFQDNWHIGAICEHLEAITAGQIKRLIINMPFRMLKSTIVSQAWPAWEWIERPSLQYLTACYAADLATRDAVASRRIIESASYAECYGDSFRMTSDQNVKTRYENNRAGSRVVTSTGGSATGFGGNRIIWDDPVNAMNADSEVLRLAAIEYYRGTLATRLNSPSEDAIVVVHQRLHDNDPTGYLLRESGEKWVHLVLPLRYEREFAKTTVLGFVDPRTEEGELLHPARLADAEASALESTMGSYHRDAQLQQRPGSRAGVMFKRADWKFYTALPELDEIVLSLDATFKDAETSDYVALHVWGRKGADKFLVDRVHDRMGFGATLQAVRTMYAKHAAKCVAVLVEDKANGSAIIETLHKEIDAVIGINPEGGKVARGYAIQPEHEAGNLHLPDPSIAPWVEEVIGEASAFPAGAHDDDVDAFTQAINWLKNRDNTLGLLDYYRQAADNQKRINADPNLKGQSPWPTYNH